MATPDLSALVDRLDGIVSQTEPPARARLAKALAQALRKSTQRRIAAQLNPDGTPFEPRKPRLRRNKGDLRRAMFVKLRTARHLKAESNADAAAVAFTPSASFIARVNQFGLRARVVKKIANSHTKYPERHLLGLADADRDQIGQITLEHLAR